MLRIAQVNFSENATLNFYWTINCRCGDFMFILDKGAISIAMVYKLKLREGFRIDSHLFQLISLLFHQIRPPNMERGQAKPAPIPGLLISKQE